MNNIEAIKELKEKTLERIVSKFGTGFGNLSEMKLSIWDVRNILYEEAKNIVKSIIQEGHKDEMDNFEREFGR